ncbi:hypothetical protein AeMF1_018881 [Aphanomyces euteiches]|nr:hypothetical protein AeMF1_018881 [Aphanomyces euteiches]
MSSSALEDAAAAAATAVSDEERQLFEMQFHLVLDAGRPKKTQELHQLEAIQLFHDHAPEFTPQELKALFANASFHLSLHEYIQIKAAKKLELEKTDEEALKRHFAVLDYHGNGSLVVAEIMDALEKTGDASVGVLKEVLANAAKLSDDDGAITFQVFHASIRHMNRRKQAAIAASTMRLHRLEAKLEKSAGTHRRRYTSAHETSLQIEYDVLKAQTKQLEMELITADNDLFAKVYERIVAQYMCETRVLEAFKVFFNHLHTEDSHLFRRNLEKNGRVVAVHPSFLLYPGKDMEMSAAFASLCDFMTPDVVFDADKNGPIFTNRAYRKIFLWYCLVGNVSNFQTMSRSNFLRFARDCRLSGGWNDRGTVLDADVDTCFILATTTRRTGWTPSDDDGPESTPETIGHQGMSFSQWVHGTTLLLCRSLDLQDMPQRDAQELLFREYVLPYGHQLEAQQLGPEVTQPQVMEFIRKNVWPLKQLFSHFGGHSMTTIELHKTISLRDFLVFARCFDILPSPDRPQPHFRQLSLHEIVQEYNAAKIDVGFAKAETRESLDLNFHEFLRCIQRLAMAMTRSIDANKTKQSSLVSSFQHFRSDAESNGLPQAHLFKHTRGLHAADRHMSRVASLVRSRLTSRPAIAPVASSVLTDSALFDTLPPLVMDNVVVPESPSPRATTARTSSTRTETPKCSTPKKTHLPISIASSPRYSAERPFSLGGTPKAKTIRKPPQLEGSALSRPPLVSHPRNNATIQYDMFKE